MWWSSRGDLRVPAGLSLVVVLAGCVSAQPVGRSATVVPATPEQVTGCTYLDDLAGVSGLYGVFADRGVENARRKALAKAESLGATHVVWGPAGADYGSSSAAARAYRCPGG